VATMPRKTTMGLPLVDLESNSRAGAKWLIA
jgi:hypothetical protein